jgi:hypothetical protein
MKFLRWILLLVFMVALWYAALAVPIGGRTLWERVSAWSGRLFESTHHSAHRSSQAEQTPQDTDQLTNKDRKTLNHLIEKKLETPPSKSNSPITTKR